MIIVFTWYLGLLMSAARPTNHHFSLSAKIDN